MRKLTAILGLIVLAWGLCNFQQALPIMGSPVAPSGGGSNPAYVNMTSGTTFFNSSPNTIATATQSVTAGNALLVFCSANNTDTGTASVTATDTAGDTLTRQATSIVDPTSTGGITAFFIQSSAGNAANAVTCHTATTTGYTFAIQVQISHAGTIDQMPKGSFFNSGTAVTTASFTTVRANEVITCASFTSFGGTTNTFTAGGTYTLDGQILGAAGDNYGAEMHNTFSSIQTGVTASMSFSASSSGQWGVLLCSSM